MQMKADELIRSLLPHVGRAEVLADVDAVYADVARIVESHRGTCQACGRCCRFGEFGHALFLTSPELVHLMTHLADPAGGLADSFAAMVRAAADCLPAEFCPLQQAGQCTIRPIRPLGCRLFFCSPDNLEWGRTAYEPMQQRMKQTCQSRSLPYGYVEWTVAIKAIVNCGR